MPMTMNQVIHAAVRRDLTRLDRALDAFPSDDAERANQLARAYRFLRHQLTDHHQSEDELIWPVIARLGVDRALLDTMESEHHEMAEALTETSAAMTALVARPETDVAAEALASVRRTRAVVDRHLDHEEDELEPALAAYLETPEWKGVEKQLRRRPMSEIGPFLAWLQDGQEPAVRTHLRSTIPPPVLAAIPALFGRSYTRLVAPAWQG
jgi:hemerythrin-like domain-containing protein